MLGMNLTCKGQLILRGGGLECGIRVRIAFLQYSQPEIL